MKKPSCNAGENTNHTCLMRVFNLGLILLAFFISSSGCQALPPNRAWSIADLRLIDPIDTNSPSTDILALYTRTIGFDTEIRIDFLDLSLEPNLDLRIHLTTPDADFDILLPAEGRPFILPSSSGMRIRLVRDPWLDAVTVRFNSSSLPQPFTMQVFSFLPGQVGVGDETSLVRSDALPPSERVPILIAFWNAYPAFSPAQALRRWDGAHTGPNGGRHGLKHILDPVERYHVPVTLLDVTTPASLAALDFEGALPQLRRLVQDGLILLPDTAYSNPVEEALEFSRKATKGFDLPKSDFVYLPGGNLVTGYQAAFLSLPLVSHLSQVGSIRLIPLPFTDPVQASPDGPSMELRQILISVLFSEDTSDLVVMGGNLLDSSWGDTDMAFPTFAWLAGHPWIQALNRSDLLTFHADPGYASLEGDPTLPVPWLDSLQLAPDNTITRSAWQMHLELQTATDDNRLLDLRDIYAGQVGFLLAAARWAESPAVISNCTNDSDEDGHPECLLANERYFAVIEMNGARLLYLFFLDENGAHQLVGPSVQFEVGISDPSQWHPDLGDAADPGAIMGAFSDRDGTFDEYFISAAGDDLLELVNDVGRTKSFQLTEIGLKVDYTSYNLVSTTIPLVVDPQVFYFQTTDYLASLVPGAWTWGPAGGARVEVRTTAGLSGEDFTSSRLFLGKPEDPNQQFPAGHYLPFPFSIVTVQGQGEFSVWIEGK